MLDLSENPDRVAGIPAKVVTEMRADAQFAPMILSDFTFLGVDNADGNGAKFLGSFRTTAGSKWKVWREYYRRLGLRAWSPKGEIPDPHRHLADEQFRGRAPAGRTGAAAAGAARQYQHRTGGPQSDPSHE
jgi:small conductance mechanosensitive channel